MLMKEMCDSMDRFPLLGKGSSSSSSLVARLTSDGNVTTTAVLSKLWQQTRIDIPHLQVAQRIKENQKNLHRYQLRTWCLSELVDVKQHSILASLKKRIDCCKG